MNTMLAAWFRSGFEDQMNVLASVEERTTAAVQRCVDDPTPDARTAATAAADEFLVAARSAPSWLRDHPATEPEVNGPFARCFDAYFEAAEILVGMGEQLSRMTPEEGGRAADAVARARRANYDGTNAFARLVQ
jgi:hypothetical protein